MYLYKIQSELIGNYKKYSGIDYTVTFLEWNIEAPAEIANNVVKVLYDCMVKAGSFFCTRCKLDADISYDENGNLPTYWIH